MIEFGLLILLCDAFEELLNVYVILNELYSKSYKYRQEGLPMHCNYWLCHTWYGDVCLIMILLLTCEIKEFYDLIIERLSCGCYKKGFY